MKYHVKIAAKGRLDGMFLSEEGMLDADCNVARQFDSVYEATSAIGAWIERYSGRGRSLTFNVVEAVEPQVYASITMSEIP